MARNKVIILLVMCLIPALPFSFQTQSLSIAKAVTQNGPDAQNGAWNFTVVPSHPDSGSSQQTSQLSFSWHQYTPIAPSGGTYGYTYTIQVASRLQYETKYRSQSFGSFCSSRDSDEWQDIQSTQGLFAGFIEPYPKGQDEGILTYHPRTPFRFTEARAKGMYFRLVLKMSPELGPMQFEKRNFFNTVSGLHGEVKAKYEARSAPYILSCDDTLIQPTVNEDPTQEQDLFNHHINAAQKKDKNDSSAGTSLEAKVFIKRLSDNKILTPSEIGYNGPSGSDYLITPTKAIPIRPSVFGQNDDESFKDYQLTVINPNKATESFSGVIKNNDSKTITVSFYEDGSPATVSEVTRNDPGISQSQFEDATRSKLDCGGFLSLGNLQPLKYATCQVALGMELIYDRINSLFANLKI